MPPRVRRSPRGPAAEAPCPLCEGAGYVIGDDGARPCECLTRRRAGKQLDRARIPPRFLDKTLATFEAKTRQTREIAQAAHAYVNSFGPNVFQPSPTSRSNGLLFIGVTGSGKTHVAVAILRAVIERGFSGLFCNVVNLLQELRDSFDPDAPQSGFEIMEPVLAVNLLVLDDLGAEAPTGWVRDRLYQIINRRYEENRPIIVTTNVESLEDLERQVGPRITSRLCEMCQRIEFPNRDWRRAHMAG